MRDNMFLKTNYKSSFFGFLNLMITKSMNFCNVNFYLINFNNKFKEKSII